jgi:hypothetical protein
MRESTIANFDELLEYAADKYPKMPSEVMHINMATATSRYVFSSAPVFDQ